MFCLLLVNTERWIKTLLIGVLGTRKLTNFLINSILINSESNYVAQLSAMTRNWISEFRRSFSILCSLTRLVLIQAVLESSLTAFSKSNSSHNTKKNSAFLDLILYCTHCSVLMQSMTEHNTFIRIVHIIYHTITGTMWYGWCDGIHSSGKSRYKEMSWF